MMRLRLPIICVLLALNACANAQSAKLIFVYDGDTAMFWLDGKKQKVRFIGVDTPELHGDCKRERRLAKAAKKFTNQQLKTAKKITLETQGRDRYKRLLAKVYVDGKRLDKIIIKAKHGRKYAGGKRKSWC